MDDNLKNMIKGILGLKKSGTPPFFTRSKVKEFTQGLIGRQTQALLDSRGEGPKGAFKYGNQVCYLSGPYVEWLIKRRLKSSGYTDPIEFPKLAPDGWPVCFGTFSNDKDKCLFCTEDELCREKTEGEAAATESHFDGEVSALMAELQDAIDKGIN